MEFDYPECHFDLEVEEIHFVNKCTPLYPGTPQESQIMTKLYTRYVISTLTLKLCDPVCHLKCIISEIYILTISTKPTLYIETCIEQSMYQYPGHHQNSLLISPK